MSPASTVQGLTFEDNLLAQRVSLHIATGSTVDTAFPIVVRLDARMPAQPLGVVVVGVRNPLNSSAAFTSAVQAMWKPIGGHQISLTYITGLSANCTYDLDLLVLGG